MSRMNSQTGNYQARTTQYLNRQPDYKLRFKPLELQLKTNGGLSVIDSNRVPVNIATLNRFAVSKESQQQNGMTIDNRQTQQNQTTSNFNLQIPHHGLISEQLFIQNPSNRQKYYRECNIQQREQVKVEELCQMHKLKVLVCVTMYSEPLKELKTSLVGITASLQNFLDKYIILLNLVKFYPIRQVFVLYLMEQRILEILVGNQGQRKKILSVSIYNIVAYFSSEFDTKFQFEKGLTLQSQYERYKLKKEKLKQYSPQQIKLILENNQLRNVYRNDQYLKFKMRKNQIYESDANIIGLMEKLYQKSLKYVNDRNNTAWVYQSVHKSEYDKEQYQTPIFYVFKYKNGSKLSSHMWFFKGFCEELKPEYCLLMDAGATPGEGAICKLIMAMEKDEKLGGVCGTMRIDKNENEKVEDQAMDIITSRLSSLFSITKCQACEYDIGHIMDKQFESSFNYIHVLPGAFSAYRMAAFTQNRLNQNETPQNILDFYLKSILNPDYEHNNIQEANMFLAEDRVLCLLLYCNGYYLKYIRDAYVFVDACSSIFMLLMQRRRWINGSWFALNYVLDSFSPKLKESNHDNWSKLKFLLSLVFAKIGQGIQLNNIGQQYFIVSFQVVWLYMILEAIFETTDTQISSSFKQIIIGLYVSLVLMLVFLSLSYNPGIVNKIKDENKKQDEKKEIHYFFFSKFYGITTILGLINLANTVFTIYLLFSQIFIGGKILQFIDQKYVPAAYLYFFVILSIGFSALPFVLWLFVNPSMVCDIAKNSINYIYYQPTYTHLFLIYAFCRIDDLSWGTKGLVSDDGANLSSDRQYQKYKFVTQWIIANASLSTIIFIMFYLNLTLIFQSLVLSFAIIFTLITMIKSIGATVYFFKFSCQSNGENASNKKIRAQARKSSAKFYNRIEANYRRVEIIEDDEDENDDEENQDNKGES